MDEYITLISKSKKEHKILKKYADVSLKIKQKYQENIRKTDPILLLEINDTTLIKIMQFLEYIKGEPPKNEIKKPITTNKLSIIVEDQFWVKYIDEVSTELLFEITEIANFLEIECLVDLCTVKIACLCFNKNEEELSKIFGITDKITEEERAKIREENKWIEENL
jgi:hypothetical protein